MINKLVEIRFADRWIDITDPVHFDRVKEAVEWASVNLKRRHNVTLQYPCKTTNSSIVVFLQIPDEIAEDFHIGNRLCGISGYLMKHYPDEYAGHMVGKRLMAYKEINNYIPKEYEYKSYSLTKGQQDILNTIIKKLDEIQELLTLSPFFSREILTVTGEKVDPDFYIGGKLSND